MKSVRQNIKDREKAFKRQRIRVFIFLIALELFFCFLIYRMFSLQCIKKDDYQNKIGDQQTAHLNMGAKRGDIYDRNFQPLAIKLKSYSLYADPSNLRDWESASQSLCSILDMPKDEILGKFRSSNYFAWLKRQLDSEVANQIRSMKMRGLAFIEEGKRFYPKGSLAAHVIGFAGVDNVGLEGVEKAYDQYIRGNSQKFKSRRDRKGRNLDPKAAGYDNITIGYDVVLTIDEVMQNIVENALQEACNKTGAVGGSVILMDPRTGEILALANYPTYDLNKAFSADEDHRRNRAIRDLYEPGSVFKVVTAAAALNENIVKPQDMIDCEGGAYTVSGRTINDVHSYNLLTFSQVLEKSSNIGITKVASRLGAEKLYKYIEAFGFNDKTGLDLSEISGFVRPLDKWTKYSMTSIPYGQELSASALHTLCSINAVANDGVIMKPFIVRGIMGQGVMNGGKDDKGLKLISQTPQFSEADFAIQFSPEQYRNPISAKTAATMTEILTKAVDDGTGKLAKVDGYKVAGKTGTAQKASSRGGYMPGKYVGSFAGFLPADNPQISMIVVIDEPKGVHTGGAVACPVFSQIATQVMQYLNLGHRFYVSNKKQSEEGRK